MRGPKAGTGIASPTGAREPDRRSVANGRLGDYITVAIDPTGMIARL
jgi:hypothetical protein